MLSPQPPAILVSNTLHLLFIVANAARSTKANDLRSRYQALLGAAAVLAALYATVSLVGVQSPGTIDEAASKMLSPQPPAILVPNTLHLLFIVANAAGFYEG